MHGEKISPLSKVNLELLITNIMLQNTRMHEICEVR
jgi:hypothetical protein